MSLNINYYHLYHTIYYYLMAYAYNNKLFFILAFCMSLITAINYIPKMMIINVISSVITTSLISIMFVISNYLQVYDEYFMTGPGLTNFITGIFILCFLCGTMNKLIKTVIIDRINSRNRMGIVSAISSIVITSLVSIMFLTVNYLFNKFLTVNYLLAYDKYFSIGGLIVFIDWTFIISLDL